MAGNKDSPRLGIVKTTCWCGTLARTSIRKFSLQQDSAFSSATVTDPTRFAGKCQMEFFGAIGVPYSFQRKILRWGVMAQWRFLVLR